jgi:hypothetical protein
MKHRDHDYSSYISFIAFLIMMLCLNQCTMTKELRNIRYELERMNSNFMWRK